MFEQLSCHRAVVDVPEQGLSRPELLHPIARHGPVKLSKQLQGVTKPLGSEAKVMQLFGGGVRARRSASLADESLRPTWQLAARQSLHRRGLGFGCRIFAQGATPFRNRVC